MFAWLLLGALAAPANGQTQSPPVGEFTAATDYEFGQAMRFHLTYAAIDPIEKATLFVKAPELPGTLTADVPVEPAAAIQIEHRLDLTEIRLAPFTYVTYWWRLEDARGQVIDIPPQSLEYVDDQFAWQELRAPGVTVRWAAEDPGIGQAALDVVAEALPEMEAIMPVELADPVRIYVYPTANDLRAALRLTGRDWIGAHARPELGVIVVAAANPRTAAVDLGADLRHELSHLLLYQAAGEGYPAVPRWLDEGLATTFEVEDNGSYAAVLENALAAGETIPFHELCGSFPESGDQTLLAYAQSVSLVRYVQTEYGNQAIAEMVRAVADGADCLTVTGRVLGLSLTELNRDWLRQLAPQSGLGNAWRRAGPLLLVVAAGFLLMLLIAVNPRQGRGQHGV
jgi:hypothetical protein